MIGPGSLGRSRISPVSSDLDLASVTVGESHLPLVGDTSAGPLTTGSSSRL